MRTFRCYLSQWHGMLLVVIVTLLPFGLLAQEFPSSRSNMPIRIVSPTPPGGSHDPAVRWIALKLGELLGHPVIADFRGGASTRIGTVYVAKSAPDGYTLLFTSNSFILLAVTAANLPFDPVRDFTPLTPVTAQASIFIVGPSLPVKTVRELVERARKAPGKLTFASSGTGTPLHLYGELFKMMAKVDVLHVPYKGSAIFTSDLLAGRVDSVFYGLSGSLPLIKAGKVTPLAVLSGRRTPMLPDVPTMSEAGVPGFDDVNSRYSMYAPAKTPPEIIDKLHASIVKVIHAPDTRQKFAEFGLEPFTTTPAEFAAYVKEQIALWVKVAKTAGVEPE